ncbi:MAG: type II toxin-antitoxin system PemK/MazF family toxin [Actinobacteria bacterium]|nr:type II toxin-antitoxin system PemK/MazF family toxin [Actinomycetota bacterium]
MVIHRGDVRWASLPDPRASEPGYRRPVLVVQADEFNRSRINTVMVVPLTGNVRLAGAPGNVLLDRRLSGLPRDSVVNVSQVFTIDKSFLLDRIRELPASLLAEVDAGLRLALAL